MYLSQLDGKKKRLFLDLSIYAAESNYEFTMKEMEIINEYCDEMGLEKGNYTPSQGFDTVLSSLKEICTTRELNMILIEIVALVMEAGGYDTLEQDFMKKVMVVFEVSDEKVEKAMSGIKQLLKAHDILNEVIESS